MSLALTTDTNIKPADFDMLMDTWSRHMAGRNLYNLSPLLPMMLNLSGEPLTLQDHYPFEPLFATHLPKKTTVIAGRQVGKTQSLSAQGVVQTCSLPYFKTLFISPLYEHIRRFSSNYVRPLIDTSPIRHMFIDARTTSNVLQRSFLNQSLMFFSYAFLSVDRIRGIPADKNTYDESARGDNTYVSTPSGQVLIRDVAVGTPIKAFSEDGHLIWTHVIKKWYAGRRRCYRLLLTNGRFVDATAESWVGTATGCFRVSSIIKAVADSGSQTSKNCQAGCTAESAESTTMADSARNTARGRTHSAERKLPRSTRAQPTGISLAQVHNIVRVRLRRTFQIEEEQTRLLVGKILDCRGSGFQVLAEPLVSKRNQDSDTKSSGDDRQGRLFADHCLVAGRRWEPLRSSGFTDADFLYQRVPTRRGQSFERMDDGSWVSIACTDSERTGLQTVPDAVCRGLGGCETHGGSTGTDAAMHAIQAPLYWAERHGDLYVLRETVPVTDVAPSERLTMVPELPGLCHGKETIRKEAFCYKKSRENTAASSQLFRASSGSCGTQSNVDSTMDEGTSREAKAIQRDLSKEATNNTDYCDAAVHGMRLSDDNTQQTCARRSSGLSRQVLAGTCKTESKEALLYSHGAETTGASIKISNVGAADRQLVPVELLAIVDVGLHDVYDVETTTPHSVLLNSCAWANCQDIDPAFIPIIRETISGSKKYGLEQFSGTPKTLDGPLENLWIDGSMAEWCIKCRECGKWNIPSLDHDLDKMIGPRIIEREISERAPAVVCAKCSKPIYPRTGRWIHRVEEKRLEHASYHMPQIIFPLHFAKPKKWNELLMKREGLGNTPPHVFYNEVCGTSYDYGAKLVSVTDLKSAATLHANTIEEAKRVMNQYTVRMLAIDWGGGGQDQISYTVFAVLGMRPGGKIDVIYGHRSLTPHAPFVEADMALKIMSELKCSYACHDYTGAGDMREEIMVKAGLPVDRSFPIAYIRATAGPMMRHIPFNESTEQRDHYRLCKARSFELTCALIKLCYIRFFKYDFLNPSQTGLLHDFLSLVVDDVSSRTGSDIHTIIRNEKAGPDDFANAVNIGVCSLCYRRKQWPNVAEMANIKISGHALSVMHPTSVNWDEMPPL